VAWAAGLPTPVAVVPGQVTLWVASLEFYVPFGRAGNLAGEAWVGDDVRLLEGAAWQPPRLDSTGHHRALRSAGGWIQVAFSPQEELELRLLCGTDQAVANLGRGTPVGDVPAIKGNTTVALAAVRSWGQLAFGAQVHVTRTSYADPSTSAALIKALTLTSQLKF
jgi:hypothetical protein